MKKIILTLSLIVTFFIISDASFGQQKGNGQQAKYVFLFIGDGMSQSHVSLAEAYLATQRGVIGNDFVSFSKFPTVSLVSTFSLNSYITDSAAAGTALSTGSKTDNGMLGVDPYGNKFKSITYKIHEKGVPVGIISTVTLDHATPAAYYANSNKRGDYYDIALQLPNTGFEFFGGGGFINPTGKEKNMPDVYKIIGDKGYKIARGVSEMKTVKKGEKVLMLQQAGKDGELPFAIDRKEGDLALKDVVSAAIEHLYSKKGFFIMAEGGKIDWAAHSNDGKADILEVLDFADAVEVAYQFYLKHPGETLILVTADHDTGGLSLGSTKGYTLNLKALDSQNSSTAVSKDSTEAYLALNKKAFVGWTTTSHSGIAVPLYTIGTGSGNFNGRIDNTDIPKLILKSMRIPF